MAWSLPLNSHTQWNSIAIITSQYCLLRRLLCFLKLATFGSEKIAVVVKGFERELLSAHQP